jgi:hypothetical protein
MKFIMTGLVQQLDLDAYILGSCYTNLIRAYNNESHL